ncbi:winged helix-turn-helix domain-containing protein [Devosia sp.]|uniref:winged helix-turn-helix domain-containing protein n=1 Tax=Devosia sp. TaxID=1871048 RepID=UPI003265F6CF
MAKNSVPSDGLTHLRVTLSQTAYIGPGRADLLEQIGATGSISAAGKAMGMSYKRAWSLVQALNDGFGAALVEASRGGSAQGGAHLTAAGEAVLKHYRAMQDKTRAAIAEDVAVLRSLTGDMSAGK